MKLARFNGDRLGIIQEREVIDVTDLVEPSPGGRLHSWIEAVAQGGFAPLDLDGSTRTRHDLASVVLDNPLPLPPKIIAAPVNYRDHQAEMAYTHTVADLGIFLKARTSTIGPMQTVQLPYTDQRVDQEAELGVIIGRRAHNLARDEAVDAIFGYTCVFDMSVRSTEDRSTRKSYDTFTPIGPWIVTADEVPDPSRLRMTCRVNDIERQNASIGDLIFDVPLLVSYASSIMTLEPGDVIATGTPAGVGPVGDGDRLEMEIPRVGRLEVTVSAERAIPYAERPGSTLDPSR